MTNVGISKSILSISSPGTHLTASKDTDAVRLTRHCNKYASDLKTKYPNKFGSFASLPMPLIAESLTEIETAISEGCDGFALHTNVYGNYLGDTVFDPVFDELNRRKAIVFIHPTTPCCVSGGGLGEGGVLAAAPLASKYPNPMMEFLFDTARVVTNLFMSGTLQRCPDIKWIIPHAGGAFPPLLSRFTGFSSLVPGPWVSCTEDEARKIIERQLWFDLAGFPFPGQIKGLLASGVGSDRLMYGSDYCFTPAGGVQMLAKRMEEGVKGLFSDEEVEGIYHGNAEALLRR